MILEVIGLAFVGLLLSICLWGLYNLPILVAGVQDFRNSRQKSAKKPLPSGRLPTFSIVVPVKNEENVIGRLLAALSKLNYPCDKRAIIIVEDGSTDKTCDICIGYAKASEGVRILHRAFSNGKPSALNHALAHAKGDIGAVFDADS